MQLILVTHCTASKTHLPSAALRARRLPRGSVDTLAEVWRARCKSAGQRLRPSDLYTGRSFLVAQQAAKSQGAEFCVISAGHGLLRADSQVPSYSLTITPNAADCILDRADEQTPFSASQWWSEIGADGAFGGVLRRKPEAVLVLAVSMPYLNMVSASLIGLGANLLDRIRIVGPKTTNHVPADLRPYVMPYDGRLNDARLGIQGTERDFSSRAARHFLQLIGTDKATSTVAEHARRVRLSLARFQAPEVPVRKPLTEARLRQIVRRLAKEGLSRTAALRYLRREQGCACEEGRFKKTWDVLT